MKQIKYNSIQEIDADLKILKVSNEIQYQKLLQKGGAVKKSLEFATIIPEVVLGAFSIFSKGLKGVALQFILKKIFKR